MNDGMNEKEGSKIKLGESKTVLFNFSPISFQPPPEPPLRDGVVRGDKESLPRPAKENSLEQYLKNKKHMIMIEELTCTSRV